MCHALSSISTAITLVCVTSFPVYVTPILVFITSFPVCHLFLTCTTPFLAYVTHFQHVTPFLGWITLLLVCVPLLMEEQGKPRGEETHCHPFISMANRKFVGEVYFHYKKCKFGDKQHYL